MKKTMKIALVLLAAASSWGCQFHARSAEDYAKETKDLLASKNDEIKSCYDEVLATDANASGVVAVDFKVAPKTGEIQEPKINADKTTAPDELGQCVITAMDGLALDPPDEREGVASFTYEFEANAPKKI